MVLKLELLHEKINQKNVHHKHKTSTKDGNHNISYSIPTLQPLKLQRCLMTLSLDPLEILGTKNSSHQTGIEDIFNNTAAHKLKMFLYILSSFSALTTGLAFAIAS